MKHLLLTFLLCLFSISGFAQKGVQFFIETGVQSGFIKSSNIHFIDYLDVIWCFAGPMDMISRETPSHLSTNYTLATSFNGGVIFNERWYLNSGLRYDSKKYTVENQCYFCEGPTNSYSIQTTAFEIPLTLRYRIIPDLPVSPVLMAETYLSFRKIENQMPNTVFHSMAEFIEETFTGYRLGVGLIYEITPHLELNLNGSWGKTVLWDDFFNGSEEETFDYSEKAKLTDYQLGFSVVQKF